MLREAAANVNKQKNASELEVRIRESEITAIVVMTDEGKTAILQGSPVVLCYKRDGNYCIENMEKHTKPTYNLPDFKNGVKSLLEAGYKRI